MVTQRCIPLSDRAGWTEALRGIPHAFGHTWASCHAMHLTTGYPTFLYCVEGQDGRVICPLAERPYEGYLDLVTPYGFSGFAGTGDAPPGLAEQWRRFVEDRGYVCGYVTLNPLLENPTHFEPHSLHRRNSIQVLDLMLPASTLYHNLDSNRKRQLRNWDRTRSGLIHDRARLTGFFLSRFHEFMRGVGASATYEFTPATLAFLAGLDNVLLIGAGAGAAEAPEAVTVVGYTEYIADYLFNVSLPEGRAHAVPLLWYAVEYLQSIQVPVFNLGGGIRPDDSVAQFKRRFGGKELPLASLKQIYRREVYQALCRRVGVDPADLNGYFPGYRRG